MCNLGSEETVKLLAVGVRGKKKKNKELRIVMVKIVRSSRGLMWYKRMRKRGK